MITPFPYLACARLWVQCEAKAGGSQGQGRSGTLRRSSLKARKIEEGAGGPRQPDRHNKDTGKEKINSILPTLRPSKKSLRFCFLEVWGKAGSLREDPF